MSNKPYMYYWTKDNTGLEWEILLEGEYEQFDDGSAIVAELDVKHYAFNYQGSKRITEQEDVPDEIRAFADSLLDEKDTYIDIQREYEKEGQHLV